MLGDLSRVLRSATDRRSDRTAPIPADDRRVGAYVRYSTPAQGVRSETRQTKLVMSFVEERLGGTLVRTYVDRGATGTTMMARPEFAALMADAKAGRINVVIVEAIDRLSRAMTDLQDVYKKLVRWGVEIYEVNGTRIDNISILFKGLQAAADRKRMLERTSGGRQIAIASGRVLSRPRFGYVVDPVRPGTRSVHRERAAAVVQIFEDYDAGMDPCEIAARLDGVVPTPQQCVDQDAIATGRAQSRRRAYRPPRWTEAMVISILRCPLYGGDIVDRTTKARKDPSGRVVGLEARPQEEHVEGRAPEHLVIVDPDLARRVIERVESRFAARERGASSSTYLLTGRLTCELCGTRLASYAQNKHRRYLCPGERDGSCDGVGRPRASVLEAVVIDAVVALVRSPDAEARYRPAYEKAFASLVDAARAKRARFEAEIAEVDAQLAMARSRGEELGFGAQTIADYCSDLEQARQEAATRASFVHVPEPAAPPDRAAAPSLDDSLLHLRAKLPLRGCDPPTRRLMGVLRAYVERVGVLPPSDAGARQVRIEVSAGMLLRERERVGVVVVTSDLPA